MGKRIWSILLAGAMISSGLSLAPAGAQEAVAPTVPAEPNIVDPAGDANFINGSTTNPAVGGDHTTPADASSLGDILAGWFSHDASTVSAHIQVEAPPPGGNGSSYNVYAAPGEGSAGANATGCLRFWLVLPGTNPGGGTFQGPVTAKLHDRCNTGGNIWDAPDVQHSIAALEDGTGVVTITAPRELSPLFADGSVLTAPRVLTASPTVGTTGGAVTPTVDDTLPGTDYTITSGGGGNDTPPPGDDTPPDDGEVGNDDPNNGGPDPEQKNCKKIKNKKKRKKCQKAAAGGGNGNPDPSGCVAYVPGEEGKDFETAVVTDAATEEAPLEIPITAPMGLGSDFGLGVVDNTESTYYNIQVDTDKAESGLYVRYEFPDYEDLDLYLNYADGSEAAHSGAFNQAPIPGVFDGTGAGGHGGMGFEQLDGIRTADCAGYTAKLTSYLSEGGEMIMKVWLGEAQNDPAAPGGGR